MRFLLGPILLAFLAAVGLFAARNTQAITVKFASWSLTAPVALLAIASYLLGMIGGRDVVAFLRNSIGRFRSQPARE